jgi:histone H3/H4
MSGLSKWTWRKYAYEGRVASTKVGRRLLIPVAEIERIMREGLRPRLEPR